MIEPTELPSIEELTAEPTARPSAVARSTKEKLTTL